MLSNTIVGLVTVCLPETTAEGEKTQQKKALPTCETINCVIILNYYASSVVIKHLVCPYQNQVACLAATNEQAKERMNKNF